MSALETTTIPPVPPSEVGPAQADAPRATGGSLVLLGLVTLLLGAWGAIAPFVGPTFGYQPAGRSPWQWSEAHGLLAAAPGVAAMVVGFLLAGVAARAVIGRGRTPLLGLGLLLLASGAWFVVGPVAWPVLRNAGYFGSGSPMADLVDRIGTSFGPGLLLAAFGGIAMGWSLRAGRRAAASTGPVERLPRRGTGERGAMSGAGGR